MTEAEKEVTRLAAEVQVLRDALTQAVPWLFEYGGHQHPHCYRGSDDGCYCGLDKAKKIVEAALEKVAKEHQP